MLTEVNPRGSLLDGHVPGKWFNDGTSAHATLPYSALGSPWNAYALCLDDALEIGKGWVQPAVKGA